ncbi:MAG: hypothetical protein K2K50_03355, partial [Anaeroplasmataceae bacterium]|nr:hypothetical protein [Anaeroplasmataceae bacterium]
MKKIFSLFLIGIVLLTGCSSKIKMKEIPLLEAKPLFQEYNEKAEQETEEQKYFHHLYYKEEKLVIEEDSKSIQTEIIYTQLDIPFFHSEVRSEAKELNITSLFQIDAFVRDDLIYYFRTMLFGERVFSKTYFICPIDYVYSIKLFGEPFEYNLYDYLLERIQLNLDMIN